MQLIRIGFLLCIQFSIIISQIPQDGLVAYYPFDNNLNDLSGNNNDGTARGTLSYTYDHFGEPNKAISFNGTDSYVDLSNIVIYPSITVSFWFNLNSLPEDWHHSDSFYLVSKENSGGYTYNYLRTEDGTYRLQSQIWATDHWETYFFDIVLNTNTWYHYISVYDELAQTLKVYLNGNIVISETNIPPTTGDDYRTTDESHIGRYLLYYPENPGADLLDGLLDEFRIYNRALSDAEIGLLYNSELPIELISFKANVIGDNVQLNWQTATEVNNYGFEVERTRLHASDSADASWVLLGFVPGHGNSNSPKEYFFLDENPGAGKLQYRLRQIDIDGQYEYYNTIAEIDFEITDIDGKTPLDEYTLKQNYPNPFNPTTTIDFVIPCNTFTTLKIFDVLGMEVSTLVEEELSQGFYSMMWDAKNNSSGIYFYTLQSGEFKETKKLLLMK